MHALCGNASLRDQVVRALETTGTWTKVDHFANRFVNVCKKGNAMHQRLAVSLLPTTEAAVACVCQGWRTLSLNLKYLVRGR